MSKFFQVTSMAVCMLIFISNICKAQFDREYTGNGVYDYKSDYPSGDLHFYLFGDGHHSFAKSPTHQYGPTPNMKLAIVAHEPPYDDDNDVEEFTFVDLPITFNNPVIPTYDLVNKIELKMSWNLTKFNDNYYIMSFENNESQTPISGCVEFHYQTQHTHIQLNNLHDDYGNDWVTDRSFGNSEYPTLGLDSKISWSFDNLAFGEQRIVYLKADCLMPATTFIKTLAVMKVNDCERIIPYVKGEGGNSIDNSLFLHEAMVQTNPHDPNMIVSLPTCLRPDVDEQKVRYRFYFQNIGEDPAINVKIDFKTSEPMEGVGLVGASSDCGIKNITAHGFTLKLDDIWLPGIDACAGFAIQNPDSTCFANVGWVDVDVCYDLDDLPHEQGECVSSQIEIYFDNEAPVSAYYDLCREKDCRDQCFFNKDFCRPLNSTLNYEGYSQYFKVNGTVKHFAFTCPSYTFQPQAFIQNAEPFEVSKEINFELYPNPANEMIRIILDKEVKEGVVVIMNMYGKVVRELSTTKSKAIDISDLSAGTYSITLKSDSSIESKLFIKL